MTIELAHPNSPTVFDALEDIELAEPTLTAVPISDSSTDVRTTGDATEELFDDLKWTEAAMAYKAASELSGHVRRLVGAGGGAWCVWDGHKWSRHDGLALLRKQLQGFALRQPRIYIDQNGEQQLDKDAERAVQALLTNRGANNVASIMEGEPAVALTPSELDSRTNELNTPDGIVDLRTGKLGPHRAEALHSRITAVAPDWTAPRDAFDSFLDNFTMRDKDLARYIQHALGASIFGDMRHQKLFMLSGPSGSGKGTFVRTIQAALGRDYSYEAPKKVLLASRNEFHPTELAAFNGPRVAFTTELSAGDEWDDARTKMLSGGDMISARGMWKDAEGSPFMPTHNLWVQTNQLPSPQDSSDTALWRRFRVIPCLHRPKTHSPAFEDRIREELPAILAWMIDGALAVHEAGVIAECKAVLEATSAYRVKFDTLGDFIRMRLAPTGVERDRVLVADAFAAYELHAKAAGVTAKLSRKHFGEKLGTEFGMTVKHTRDGDAISGHHFHGGALRFLLNT